MLASEAQVPQFPIGESDPLLEAIQRSGAAIAPDVFSTAWCDQLMRDFATPLSALTLGRDQLGYRSGFYGEATKRLHGLFRWSEQLSELVLHPPLLNLIERSLLRESRARSLRISNAELMVIYEGQAAQVLHRDNVSWPIDRLAHSPAPLLNVIVALSDFMAERGATRVIPRSHHWPREMKSEVDASIPIEMSKGSVLLYSGNLWHGGGAHAGGPPRAGLYIGWIPSWLKPLENHLATNGTAAFDRLPRALQTLLDVEQSGFTVYA